MKKTKISICQIEMQMKEFENGAERIMSTSRISFLGENNYPNIICLVQNAGGIS